MNFTRIEDAIKTCKTHLDTTGTRGTEVESFLVRYLLVLICAEQEMCMEMIFKVRASKVADGHIANVAIGWAHGTTKRMKISDIAGHLACFDPLCKDEFQNKIAANNMAHVAYTNLQSNRHKVAHAIGPQTTLVELEKFFMESKPVLDAIAEALNFTSAEIGALVWP